MSIIYGVINLEQEQVDLGWRERMEQASEMFPCNRTAFEASDYGFLSCRQLYNTPESLCAQLPILSADQKHVLVFDGRLDNREELAADLHISLSERVSDETLILAAYERHGDMFAQHLLGDFAIAILDRQTGKLALARDHLGARPLYFAQSDNHLAFASHQSALLCLPWVDRGLNDQWIADYLEVNSVGNTYTAYCGIHRLAPAHILTVMGRSAECRQYWTLDAKPELSKRTDLEYIEGFRRRFREAVECRMRAIGGVATELSGGIDSCAIAAFAKPIAQNSGKPLSAFSHMLAPEHHSTTFPFFDESENISAFCKMHPEIAHDPVYSPGLGVLSAYDYTLQVHGAPPHFDLTLMGDEIFRRASTAGHVVMLSGFGGDQCASSKGGGWVEEATAERRWDYLRSELAKVHSNRFRAWLVYVANRLPLVRSAKRTLRLISNRIAEHFSYKFSANKAFAGQQGYPSRALRSSFHQGFLPTRMKERNKVLSADVPERLEESALGAASYGMEYRTPMLDVRLVEYCLSMPIHLKFRDGTGRRLISDTMRGLLPDQILDRDTKRFAMIPSSYQRDLHDRDALKRMVRSWIANGDIGRYVHFETNRNESDIEPPSIIPEITVKANFARRFAMFGIWFSRMTAKDGSDTRD